MLKRLLILVVIAFVACSQTPEKPKQQPMSEAEKFYRDGTEMLDTDPAKAIELITKSLELNPDAPPALYNRASAYARVGRDAEAVGDLERLETVAPDIGRKLRAQFKAAAGGYTSIAEDEFKKKNFDAAIKKCDVALVYNPAWADAWVVKGLCYQELGDTKKALECIAKGAEVEPLNYFVYINRAEIFQKQKRLQDALADYTKAIDLLPNEPAPYAGRAIVYAALGMLENAMADEAKAKELRTKHEDKGGK